MRGQEYALLIAHELRRLKPGQKYNIRDLAKKVGAAPTTVISAIEQSNRFLGGKEKQFHIPVSRRNMTFTLPDQVRIPDLTCYRPTQESTGVRGRRAVGFQIGRRRGTGDER